MPRPGPRRPLVAIRLADEGIDWLDTEATRRGLVKGSGEPNRSEMIRLCLAYAQRHMPKDWTP
jgi:hypothetical protein